MYDYMFGMALLCTLSQSPKNINREDDKRRKSSTLRITSPPLRTARVTADVRGWAPQLDQLIGHAVVVPGHEHVLAEEGLPADVDCDLHDV